MLAWCAQNNVESETLKDKFFIINKAARINTDEGKQ